MDETRFFPPRGSPQSAILAYRDRKINRWSVTRDQTLGRIALSIWYYLSRQWAELDFEGGYGGVRGSILRYIDNDDLPHPITNEIDLAIVQELVALVGPKWIPKVVPTSDDPDIKAAAQVSQNGLIYRLKTLEWPETRVLNGMNFALMGTSTLYTGWDRSYETLKNVGVTSAVWCSACSSKFYSAEIPEAVIRSGKYPINHAETIRALPPAEEHPENTPMALLTQCPNCAEPHPLEPYTPNSEEAASADDVFGRPLGMQEPRGCSVLEADMPHEIYPENGGIRITPGTMQQWCRQKIRSLEWIEARYPHLAHLVEADSISDLLYDDPIYGDWETLSLYHPRLDAGILDHHARVQELVQGPTFRNPFGRYVVATQKLVLEDSDLLEPARVPDMDEEMFVERAKLSMARFKVRPGEIWGTGKADTGISPQNRLNGIDGVMVEKRLRMGPYICMTPGQWVEGGAFDQPGLGKFLFLQPDPNYPDRLKPDVFQGPVATQEEFQERENTLADLHRVMGPSPASQGINPTGVGNTSQLQLLIEQDEKNASVHTEAHLKSIEKSWSHMQQLQWLLGADNPEIYRVMGKDGAYKYESYVGAAIRGQWETEVERQPAIAHSVMMREAAREAITDGVVSIESPMARARMAEKYGIDIDINEDTNNQVNLAERKWADFYKRQIVPVQDPIDDAAIHYQVFGTHLTTDEAQRLAKETRWPEIVPIIAGWELKLQEVKNAEDKSIMFYGGRLMGEQAQVAWARATLAYQQKQQIYTQQKVVHEALAASSAGQVDPVSGQPVDAGLPPEPPTPPPPPVQIPVLLQQRIMGIWASMLEAVGFQFDQAPQLVPTQAPDPQRYMKFRALVEAYKITLTGIPPNILSQGAPTAPGEQAPVDTSVPSPGTSATIPANGQAGKQANSREGRQPANPPAVASLPEGGPN